MKERDTSSGFALLSAALLLGCSLHNALEDDDAGGPSLESPCAEQEDGTACGGGRHCIDGRCQNNVCGDGVQAGTEACDDGNRDPGDGCAASCTREESGCAEGDEACDGGSATDGSDPTGGEPVCGNGIVELEAGEVCDGPRIVQDGEGRGEREGCSADCAETIAEDECEQCQNTHCVNYGGEEDGIDVVAGCFQRPDPTFTADPGPDFTQACIDLVNCALANDCAFHHPVNKGAACYCGSAEPDECNTRGPAPDAPCVKEWQEASGSERNDEIQARFADFTYASAWGYFLLECYQAHCEEQCTR